MAIALLLCHSCAGYRFKYRKNPLGKYNISKLSVPMFVNQSAIPHLSGPLTKEFSLLLSSYPGLKIYPGDDFQSDAILIGVITSNTKLRKAQSPQTSVPITNEDGQWRKFPSMGDRQMFWVPNMQKLQFYITLTLIKNPTHQLVTLVKSSMGQYMYNHPQIIFSQTHELTGDYLLEIYDLDNNPETNTRGEVIFTQNLKARDILVQNLARSIAETFKQTTLYAF